MRTRTQKFLKNIFLGAIFQIIAYVISFIARTVFISVLGKEYLGIQGLFSSILSLLSLTELGIGSAITFCLYEPLAKNDVSKIRILMKYYEKAYKVVSLCVLGLGLAMFPFLGFIVKETPQIKDNISLIYLLFLLNSVFSYLFIYKKTIFTADQKEYLNSIVVNLSQVVRDVLQLIVLLVTADYILYLIIQILFTITSNIIISYRADRMYPYLKESSSQKLEKKDWDKIKKNIFAMFNHNIGAFLTTGTDNLLIAKFVSLTTVGVYSNYTLIISIITKFVNQLASILTPGIGNLSCMEEKSQVKKVFDQLFLLDFLLTLNVSVGMFIGFNPFVELWVGTEYLFSLMTVVLIIIQFYLYNIRTSLQVFRNALGLYYIDRYKPFIESFINLAASLILVKYYGLNGIILGTIIGFICTTFWVEPYILFRHYFELKSSSFFKKYVEFTLLGVICAVSSKYIFEYIFVGGWLSLIVSLIICSLLLNVFLIMVFWKDQSFQLLLERIKGIKGLRKYGK